MSESEINVWPSNPRYQISPNQCTLPSVRAQFEENESDNLADPWVKYYDFDL